jgi:UDP-2,3-diacylglucosamine pyrophosphatase LpxH
MQEALDPREPVFVVSDMHIGDGTLTDPFAGQDASFRRFLERVARDGGCLVIAGDGFDLAQAWSLERIERAHRGLFADLRALARERTVFYLQGNHDGTAAELATMLPLRFATALRLGADVHVEHGHRFDVRNQPGDERAVWGARAHALLERLIRSPVRIPMRRHYCWSTRLGHWLFFRYGWLRLQQGRLRACIGDRAAKERAERFLDYWGRGEWGDIHDMLPGVERALEADEARVLVCGHSHQPGEIVFGRVRYLNTGSWTHGAASYVILAPDEVGVRAWPSGRPIGDEEYRGVIGPHRNHSFFDWWERFYLGWLRYDVDGMWREAEARAEERRHTAAARVSAIARGPALAGSTISCAGPRVATADVLGTPEPLPHP